MEEKLKGIFIKVLGSYDSTKKQSEYERWDSFAHMELVSEVESVFNVSLTVDQVVSIESAQDILKILQSKNG
ncbi:acyl carrier protein [Candidatus Pacearchaeota archaeon]|nr:acyl carrier protein [Candidatus Pacearchaeota archaeon]